VSPDTRNRPVPSFRWEAARTKPGSISTSAKSSRTKGRSMHFDSNRSKPDNQPRRTRIEMRAVKISRWSIKIDTYAAYREGFRRQNFHHGSSDSSGTAHRVPLGVKKGPRNTRTRSFGELYSCRLDDRAECSSLALVNVPFRSSSETWRRTRRNRRSFSRRALSEPQHRHTNPPSLDGAIIFP
jgi:hypothetical protein